MNDDDVDISFAGVTKHLSLATLGLLNEIWILYHPSLVLQRIETSLLR